MGGGSAVPVSHNRGAIEDLPSACSYVAFAVKEDLNEDARNADKPVSGIYDQLMDPLSLTSSIIAVVGVATTTTKVLTRIVKSFNDAPSEIHALNTEVTDFQAILLALEETMAGKHGAPKSGEQNRSGPDALLEIHLQNATEALDRLNHFLAAGLQRQNSSQLRVWWIRNKSRARALHCEIRNARTNLQTSLCLVNW